MKHREDLFQTAKHAYEEGRHKEALICLNQATEAESNFVEAYYLRAMVRMELGYTDMEFYEAVSDLDKVIELDGNCANAYAYRAILRGQIDNNQESILKDCEQALLLNTDVAYVYHIQGMAAFKAGRFEEAVESLKQRLVRERHELSIIEAASNLRKAQQALARQKKQNATQKP